MLDHVDKNGFAVTSRDIGILDGVFLAFYSIGLFFAGLLVDNYSSKFIVNLSLMLTTLLIFLIKTIGFFSNYIIIITYEQSLMAQKQTCFL